MLRSASTSSLNLLDRLNKSFLVSARRNTYHDASELNAIKKKRCAGLPQFYRTNFINNEIRFSKKLTRDTLAIAGHTSFGKLSKRQTSITTASYFFNPKFKFGFIFYQEANSLAEAIPINNGEIFKIQVYASSYKFLPEQENNVFLHYINRKNAYSVLSEKCFLYSAQFSPVLYSRSAIVFSPQGRAFLSENAKEISDFFYKRRLSRFNVTKNIYRASRTYNKLFKGTGVFWHKQRLSRNLKKFRKLVKWNYRMLPAMFNTDYISTKKVRKQRSFLKGLQDYWANFVKVKKAFRRLKRIDGIYMKPIWIRTKKKLSRYLLWKRHFYLRKKMTLWGSVYNKARLSQFDCFTSLRLLKKSWVPGVNRYRKKKHRAPLVRLSRKSFNQFF